MRDLTPKASRMRKQLVKDPLGYLESVGKHDSEALEHVLNAQGGDKTVLRLFFGATTNMPFRALGYVTSAARAAQMLPVEQLQIITVASVGESVNKTPKEQSLPQFMAMAGIALHVLQKTMPDVAERTVFAQDVLSPHISTVRPLAMQHLEQDPTLARSLRDRGAKHGGDFVTYAASHVVYQDTGLLDLEPLIGNKTIVSPHRIVTVGCQQERVFYAARMGVKALMNPELLIPSVQIFTKHISAPYFEGRGGEPMLSDTPKSGPIGGFDLTVVDPATKRDLDHFKNNFMNKEHKDE